jgi:hypothetical protein
MAMVSGPEHRFTLVNPEYRKLIGGRDVLGLAVRDALPEVVDQAFSTFWIMSSPRARR